MSDSNTPNPDDSNTPPNGAPGLPPQTPYAPPNQSGSWPPAPAGAYNQVGQPYSPVNATMILILGVLGLTICSICAPIAWVMGNQALSTLDQFGDPLGQRGMVNGGRICGIIGTALICLAIVVWVVAMMFGVGSAMLHPSS